MKKAFDQNVSRAKPRLKLGGPTPEPAEDTRSSDESWVYEVAAQVAGHHGVAEPPPTARELLDAADRAAEEEREEASARSRVEATLRETAAASAPEVREERVVEEERVTVAVGARATGRGAQAALPRGPVTNGGPVSSPRSAAEVGARPATRAPSVSAPAARPPAPASRAPSPPPAPAPDRRPPPSPSASLAPERRAPPPAVRTETVAPPAPSTVVAAPVARRPAAPPPPPQDDNASRRERLRERLRTVREHPRPEPLPTSVAAAGVLAVERIAQLQGELNAAKQHNAALQHDLDVARRTAERATEEARGRVEEARRLVAQMEERAGLLAELERELQSVEGERDESLLALQDARTHEAAEREERERVSELLAKKDVELADSLSEEERLAGELERFRDDSVQLHRSVDALSAERDTLARQVADLTAERAELLEARKALESVHRALTEAARR